MHRIRDRGDQEEARAVKRGQAENAMGASSAIPLSPLPGGESTPGPPNRRKPADCLQLFGPPAPNGDGATSVQLTVPRAFESRQSMKPGYEIWREDWKEESVGGI